MEKILNRAITIILFATPFVTLLVANELFFPFITGKNFTFRFLVELALLLWGIAMVYYPASRPTASYITQCFLAFVAIMGVATFFSEYPFKSFWSNFERMEGYVTLLHLFAYFLVFGSVVRSWKVWNRWWHTVVGVSLFISFFAILQLLQLFVINQGGVRVDGTFGNAAYLGAFLLFSILISVFLFVKNYNEGVERGRQLLYVWIASLGAAVGVALFALQRALEIPAYFEILGTTREAMLFNTATVVVIGIVAMIYCVTLLVRFCYTPLPRVHYSILYATAILLQVGMLYFTATRGAILGLLGGVGTIAILWALPRNDNRLLRRSAQGVLLALVLAASFFVLAKDTEFVQQSTTLQRFAVLVSPETFEKAAGPRLRVWSMGWQGFLERPLLGWGQESFNFVFNKHYDVRMYNQEQWFDRSHNIFLDWLIAGGLLGLLGYLSLYVAFLIYIWRSSASYNEKTILTGVLGGYFTQNFFVFDNIGTYILFVALLAYAHSQYALATDSDKKRTPLYFSSATKGILVVCVAIVFVLILQSVIVKPLHANRLLIEGIRPQENLAVNYEAFVEATQTIGVGFQETAEQLSQYAVNVYASDAPQEVKDAFLVLAEDAVVRQINHTPNKNDARSMVFLGSLYDAVDRKEDALNYFNGALALSPNKQSLLATVASIEIDLGNVEKAREILEKTLALEPRNDRARSLLIATLLIAEDVEEANRRLFEYEEYVPSEQIVALYFRYDRVDMILEIWTRLAEAYPDNLKFWVARSAAHAMLGQSAEAIKALEHAISIDPAFREQGEYFINEIKAGRNPVDQTWR